MFIIFVNTYYLNDFLLFCIGGYLRQPVMATFNAGEVDAVETFAGPCTSVPPRLSAPLSFNVGAPIPLKPSPPPGAPPPRAPPPPGGLPPPGAPPLITRSQRSGTYSF